MSTEPTSPSPRRRARTKARLLAPTVIRALSTLESEAAADQPDLPESARALVGRDRLLELLSQVPDLDPQELKFLAFYADPRNSGKSLGRLCSDFGLLPAHFVKLLARAEGARALMQALRIAAEHTPEVVRGAMVAAKVEVLVCPGCKGGGADPTSTPEEYVPCPGCSGSGQVQSLPDVQRVKLALEVGGVVKAPGGMTLNVSAQAQAQAATQSAVITGDVFDKFRAASQRVMRGVLRPAVEQKELPPAREIIQVESVFAGAGGENVPAQAGDDLPAGAPRLPQAPQVEAQEMAAAGDQAPPGRDAAQDPIPWLEHLNKPAGLGPPPGRRPEPR